MPKGAVEIDFLGLEEGASSSTSGHETSSNQSVHNFIAPKLSTQLGRTGAALARTAISTYAAPAATAEGFVASRPMENSNSFLFLSPLPWTEQRWRSLAPMPMASPASRPAAVLTSPAASAPLTIFYNGVVATFNLPRDKAEAIIKLTEGTAFGVQPTETPAPDAFVGCVACSGRQQLPPLFLLQELGGDDLLLARKRSLQRFLEKRKER